MQSLPETSHLIIKPRSVADTLKEADLGARSFLQLLVRLNPMKLTANILWAYAAQFRFPASISSFRKMDAR